MLTRILSRLRRTTSSDRPAKQQKARVLNLEALEAREVPATIYALTPNNALLRFDSATPTTIAATTSVTGLGANQTLIGIDFRPRTGQLVGSAVTTGSANNSIVFTYSINPLTGAATLIGRTAAALTGAGDVPGGYDFNPTVDRIRYVNSNNENARFNPVNGTLAGNDTDLTFTLPAAGPIVGSAYDRNTDRMSATGFPTTLFGITSGSSSLVVQGGINGAVPPGPNGGAMTNVGALGFTLDAGVDAGFDIQESALNGGLGTAFAVFTVGGVARLYSLDLTTGAASLVGALGSSDVPEVASIAVVPNGVVVVGSGLGANGDVRLLDPVTGAVRQQIVPFVGFQGGVRVATGDVNRDGIPDAIVSAIAPQGHVKVFDGATGQQLPGLVGSFFAFQGFNGTVNVASGDVNGDGFSDVIVSANGANGHVKAFSGADGTELASFLAYQGFLGNVTVSAADFDNNGIDEIVTVAAANGHTRVFLPNGTLFGSTALPNFNNNFFAFSGFPGDVNVAAGDVNGDGFADIVVSSGAGTRGHVRAFSGPNNASLASFFAYNAGSVSGAFVGLADVNNDGLLDIRVTPGRGLQADVSAFDLSGQQIGAFPAFGTFLGGSTVAGARF